MSIPGRLELLFQVGGAEIPLVEACLENGRVETLHTRLQTLLALGRIERDQIDVAEAPLLVVAVGGQLFQQLGLEPTQIGL